MTTAAPSTDPVHAPTAAALQLQVRTSAGMDLTVTPVRVTRNTATFETYSLSAALRVSEVLAPLQITMQGRLVYDGTGVVRHLVDDGTRVICEATLTETAWLDLQAAAETLRAGGVGDQFRAFTANWQEHFRVRPEVKLATTNLITFLGQLRAWLAQVELGLRGLAAAEQPVRERAVAGELGEQTFPYLDELFDALERGIAGCDASDRPRHAAFVRQQLHPFLLGSPFAHRTVHKPLGYAGDYEVVNMIVRDPHEGGSLYARVLNHWFLRQPPAAAHRNRVAQLVQTLTAETLRVQASGRTLTAFNLGCGPAWEIQQFLRTQPLSNHTAFTLVDFNEETLSHAAMVLTGLRDRHARRTEMRFQKKSATSLLRSKPAARGGNAGERYDLVYCAGLFDYLATATCKRLVEVFYDLLAPGGLLLVTNVDARNPIRHWLEDVLDWHLIYRSGADMTALRPESVSPDDARVYAESTGLNLFLEIRKPRA